MTDALILVVPYRSEWSALFLQEQAVLCKVLSPWLVGIIEHIGSTAVPALAAKPVIDIMAPILSLEGAAPAIDALRSAGYVYYPYKPEVMHWFCKPSPEIRTHHLHLVPLGSKLWHDQIDFRNALRKNDELREEYQVLKLRLARQHERDREAYTEAKAPFISRVLALQRSGKSGAA